jgi:integrase/recombinase XerC/integrase/recombinase XerD
MARATATFAGSRRQPEAGERASVVSVRALERHVEGWLLDGEIRQLSRRTLAERRILLRRFVWFVNQQEFESVGKGELRAYLGYLYGAHEQGGRWGDARRTKPLRPTTTKTHYVNLKVFFRWLVQEGAIDSSPMEALPPPVVREDQIQPFSEPDLLPLLDAARRTRNAKRDEASLLVMLATGARASEICGLRMADLDLSNRQCTVTGKGNKKRALPLGKAATKALWDYLRGHELDNDDPIFRADAHPSSGNALSRGGLLQLYERLGRAAGLRGVRCSPHTMRHTAACLFLANGGNVFTLQVLMGHRDIGTTRRYAAIVQADVQRQHAMYCAADRLKRR